MSLLPRLQRRGEVRPLSVLLVEHRDEVFARLEADLKAAGCIVRRADQASRVWPARRSRRIDLVITHVFLPDGSGWLIAAKVRFVSRDLPIWLYTPNVPPYGASLAEFVGVDQRIYYGGNLWQLSAEILRLLPTVRPARETRGPKRILRYE